MRPNKRTLFTRCILSIESMRKRWFLLICAVILATSLLGVLAEYSLPLLPQEPKPWMFIGAYATYSGDIPGFSAPYTLNATLVVTDINSTHVKVATNSTIGNSFSPQPLTDRTVQWINITNINFQHKGETLADTHPTQIPVKGIGPRQCIVYNYVNTGGINSTYYLDSVLQWPLRIVYVTAFENQTYTLEFNLNDTNIKNLR